MKLEKPQETWRRILEESKDEKLRAYARQNLATFYTKNRNGTTLLHEAIKTDTLQNIPKEFLTGPNLSIQDKYQTTPLYMAASRGLIHLCQTSTITEAQMTKQNKLGNSALHESALYGEIDLLEFSPHESSLRLKNQEGNTPLHFAVMGAFSKNLPHKILENNIMLQNNRGQTLLHCAAEVQRLSDIPERLLTYENLMVTDSYGETPIHIAAKCGCLDQIPSKVLLTDALFQRNNAGCTPFYTAGFYGHIDQVPKSLVTEDELLVKQPNGKSLLELIVQYERLDQLLGVNLSVESIDIVGKEWNSKNNAYISQLEKSKERLLQTPQDNAIEIF